MRVPRSTLGQDARREWNRRGAAERNANAAAETIQEAIRILKADMNVALAKGNVTIAKAKATAIENCRARLARAHQEPS